MAKESRRKLLKGLGISIPTAWAAPIIEAVILPAHAQSSGGDCDLPAGCYLIEGAMAVSVDWDGGTGPQTVFFRGADCIGDQGSDCGVVAADEEAARDVFGESTPTKLDEFPITGQDCSFWTQSSSI